MLWGIPAEFHVFRVCPSRPSGPFCLSIAPAISDSIDRIKFKFAESNRKKRCRLRIII